MSIAVNVYSGLTLVCQRPACGKGCAHQTLTTNLSISLHPEQAGTGITDFKGVVMIENLTALRAQFSTQPPQLSTFDEDHPCRLNHLSFDQQKKRAKDLLKQWRASDDVKQQNSKLTDAQHVIAKEYGFKNWAQLKTYIVQARFAREAVEQGEPSALDAGRRTLHIRCGSDIQHSLAVAGFSGDFLNVPDPYVHGPVCETETRKAFIELRAKYLSEDHHPEYDEVLDHLTGVEKGLEEARNYEAVYLWFEHDPHDQLMLASLLDYFSDKKNSSPILKMITITNYPGVKRFNGVGQLPPEAMPMLWNKFEDVTHEQLEIGKKAWAAIRSPTPEKLLDLIAMGTPVMPTMAIALDRFVKQLPSKRNGLNLTENLTLQILSDRGATTAARLFGAYNNTYEPLTFMGDSGYWHMLDDLAQAKYPAIVLDKQGEKPGEWHILLTGVGREYSQNKKDWLELNDVDRWVGGVHIATKKGNIYRVDA